MEHVASSSKGGFENRIKVPQGSGLEYWLESIEETLYATDSGRVCKHRGAIYWEVDLYSAEGKASCFEIEKVVNDKRYGYCTQW